MSISLDVCPQCHCDSILGVMDYRVFRGGALFWRCEDCDYAWPRSFLTRPKLAAASRRGADKHNRMRQR